MLHHVLGCPSEADADSRNVQRTDARRRVAVIVRQRRSPGVAVGDG
jgi:hypothetical protein